MNPATRLQAITNLHGIDVGEVADSCRSAALGFAWGARDWSKRELARWLIGPYARATAPARALRASGVRAAIRSRTVDEPRVQELLARTHARVVGALAGAWSWPRDAGFARDAVDRGLVGGVVDDTSGIGYAPIDQLGMSLEDRVLSLFVADYLTRPGDYAAFTVCVTCGGASFDGGLEHDACGRDAAVLHRRVG